MPVFRSGKGKVPAWSELENFEFLELKQQETKALIRCSDKEQIIVCSGWIQILAAGFTCELAEGSKIELTSLEVENLQVVGLSDRALIFRALGHWKSINSSGIFAVNSGDACQGDTPHDYTKTTTFDNHYHDCDEYWMVFEGKARVASEGNIYEVGPGDCIATGMGWHHDVISLEGKSPLRAIWFEGTLEGLKRVGHLWEPTHGKAEPHKDRV